jgi:hypothetical protein
MEVTFTSETESRLRELAQETRRTPSDLVADATERYLRELSGNQDSHGDALKTTVDRPSRRAALDMAEYNALTNRITYYVTLQYATWGLAAALFGYLAPLWTKESSSHRNLEWIAILSLLTVSWAGLHILYEMLVIVCYLMEELLKNLAADYGLKPRDVWGFEGWIRTLRWLDDVHRNYAIHAIFVLAFSVLVGLLYGDVKRGYWGSSDTWWSVVCGCLTVIVAVKVWRFMVLSRELQRLSGQFQE